MPHVPTEEERLASLMERDKREYGAFYNEEVQQIKTQWLRDNYGDKFVCNNLEFVYDTSYKKFVVYDIKKSIHLMTSTSTSKIGYLYYVDQYNRVAEYLGYYGTDHDLYNNEEAFNYRTWRSDDDVVWSATEFQNAGATNLQYLYQLGWKEDELDEEKSYYWSMISAEGIPVSLSSGYISFYVKYPTDEKEKEYRMTIEEYNEFVATYTWTVATRSWKWGMDLTAEEDATTCVLKYLLIEE